MSLPSILPEPPRPALTRAASVLDVTAETRALPPVVYQAAWFAAKQARGQSVHPDRLRPAHLIAPTAPETGTVAQIDAAQAPPSIARGA